MINLVFFQSNSVTYISLINALFTCIKNGEHLINKCYNKLRYKKELTIIASKNVIHVSYNEKNKIKYTYLFLIKNTKENM